MCFRGMGWNPYSHVLYRNMAIFIETADIVVIFFFETLKNVLKKRTLCRIYRDTQTCADCVRIVDELSVFD